MGKTILVTGKEGFLGNEITQHFLRQGCQVAASVSARKEGYPTVDQDHTFLQFPWSRRSPVAAKNFLLQTLQAFETIDEAWLIITPEREIPGLAETAPLVLDESIDAGLKGLLYLVRELLQHQATHPSLVLRFVFFDEDPPTLPPVASVQYHGLKGLVTSLLAQARKRHLAIWAYEASQPQVQGYLAYLLSSKDTLPGRWNLWGEKKPWRNSLFRRKETA